MRTYTIGKGASRPALLLAHHELLLLAHHMLLLLAYHVLLSLLAHHVLLRAHHHHHGLLLPGLSSPTTVLLTPLTMFMFLSSAGLWSGSVVGEHAGLADVVADAPGLPLLPAGYGLLPPHLLPSHLRHPHIIMLSDIFCILTTSASL